MPRKDRIDAPGAVHHIIIRGIERRKIFRSDPDRSDFIERLAVIVNETQTQCLAWALIPNHVHLLFRTGKVPIATVMQRLLTGYAVSFNRKYRRHGQLFQNRYKSILCQEDPYLKELVRYIHLNPLRANLVEDLNGLERFNWCGHGVLAGKRTNEWQAIEGVLKHFGKRRASAIRAYREFVSKGAAAGRQPELTGGGLIRSAGGWDTVKNLRKSGIRLKGDERILGDTDFVLNMLARANEDLSEKTRFRTHGIDFDAVVARVAQLLSLPIEAVRRRDKTPQSVKARRLICHFAHNDLGLSTVDIAKHLNIHQSVVSRAARQGRLIAEEDNYHLEDRNA
jgi:REP element-mobilizing transposase RayT